MSKFACYIKEGDKADTVYQARFSDDFSERFSMAGPYRVFDMNHEAYADDAPEVEGYKGPIDVRTGNTVKYEKEAAAWREAQAVPFTVLIRDRMETKENIFWAGDDAVEFLRQTRRASELLEFLGIENRTFKVSTRQP